MSQFLNIMKIDGITFQAKEGFKLLVKGTDYELDSIYVRTRFTRNLGGNELEVQGNIYANKIKFQEDENSVLSSEIVEISTGNKVDLPPIGNYGLCIIPENHDNNDLLLSHQHVITKLNEFLDVSGIEEDNIS